MRIFTRRKWKLAATKELIFDALQLAQWEVNGIKTDRPNQLFSSRIDLNPKLKVSKVASGYGETVIPLSLVRLSPKKRAV